MDRQGPDQAIHKQRRKEIDRPFRIAAILTLSFTFIALWVAFVTTGDEPLEPGTLLSWLSSVVITLFLIGVLFLTGLAAASALEDRGWGSLRQSPAEVSTAIAAGVAVGATLGLVFSLRTMLWGGPALLRWTIVGLVTATVLAGSGQATGCAALGGLMLAALGAWAGIDRELTGRIDLIFTGWLVGTTVGAVGGTLWKVARR